jgi:hypothetical protein
LILKILREVVKIGMIPQKWFENATKSCKQQYNETVACVTSEEDGMWSPKGPIANPSPSSQTWNAFHFLNEFFFPRMVGVL